MGYYWDTLKKHIKQISADKHTSDMHTLTLSLNTDMTTHITSDFIKMRKNACDNGEQIYQFFNQK